MPRLAALVHGSLFASKEEAIAYCERQGIPYQVFEDKKPARRTMAYADNFAYSRRGLWTH